MPASAIQIWQTAHKAFHNSMSPELQAHRYAFQPNRRSVAVSSIFPGEQAQVHHQNMDELKM